MGCGGGGGGGGGEWMGSRRYNHVLVIDSIAPTLTELLARVNGHTNSSN